MKRLSYATVVTFLSVTMYAQCVPQPPASAPVISLLGRELTFSNVSINGGGNSANLIAGASFIVAFDFNVSTTITACPGCITFFYVGVAGTVAPASPGATVYPNTDCFGSVYAGQTGSHVSNFTAPTSPGYYYITIDATWTYWCHQYVITHNNCLNRAIALIVVGNPPPLTVMLDSISDVTSCGGSDGGIFITPIGGAGCYQYSWSYGGTTQNLMNSAEGFYTVTVSDGGCDTVLSGTITAPAVGFSLPADTALCVGDSLLLNAGLVDSVIWQDSSHALNYLVNAAGIYWITAFSGLCSQSDTITVSFNPLPTPYIGNDTILCQGNSLTLDAGVGYDSYLWQGGSQQNSVLVTVTGIYWAEVSLNSCVGRDSTVITFDALPVINLGNDTIICEGFPLLLNAASPGAAYNWQDGAMDSIYSVTNSGVYSVTVTNGVCIVSDMVAVTVNQFPVVNLDDGYLLCGDDTIVLDVSSSGSSFLWQDGSTQPSYSITTSGAYSVDVFNGPCMTSDTTEVSAELFPEVNLGVDLEKCVGELDTLIDASFLGASYLWHDNSTASAVNVKTPGVYSVTVTNQCGNASDSISVNVKDCGCKVVFASAFSPNGDGKNDFFRPLTNCVVQNYKLIVFNRWGEKVFESNDTRMGWDGFYKEALLDLGVYMYYTEYSIPDGNGGVFNSEQESGSVTLVR